MHDADCSHSFSPLARFAIEPQTRMQVQDRRVQDTQSSGGEGDDEGAGGTMTAETAMKRLRDSSAQALDSQ